MINSRNIYKLIKKAKDEHFNSSDPISKIIQNPITFIYSFTLNAQNEPIIEEENEISFITQNKQIKDKIENKIKINSKKEDIKNDKKEHTENKILDKLEKNKINEKEKIFLNKKREYGFGPRGELQSKEEENKSSKIVKNKIIHQIYNSKNINLWENESSDEDNEKNYNILPIHKQIEFIDKCRNEFSKHNVEKKSEYDKELDKGKLKKIHKNKIGFKKHKNYFQKISNKQRKNQFKSFSNNNKFTYNQNNNF